MARKIGMPSKIEVYDTPSGLGGTHTVSIVADHGDTCEVRVWYGCATRQGWEGWPDWNGHTFTAQKSDLTNRRMMALKKETA